ncbi:hypothetical protein KJ656_01905 [bacterium]|nr:hypothetical protein [bacterium]
MITINASEIKRRGISVVDELLRNQKSVPVIHRSKVKYIILEKKTYDAITTELEESVLDRVLRSESDYQSERFHKGSAADLIADIIGH